VIHEGPLRGLLIFSGLRSLHITIQFQNVEEQNRMGGCAKAGKDCKLEILRFLKKHKEKFGGKVLTVAVSFRKTLYRQLP